MTPITEAPFVGALDSLRSNLALYNEKTTEFASTVEMFIVTMDTSTRESLRDRIAVLHEETKALKAICFPSHLTPIDRGDVAPVLPETPLRNFLQKLLDRADDSYDHALYLEINELNTKFSMDLYVVGEVTSEVPSAGATINRAALVTYLTNFLEHADSLFTKRNPYDSNAYYGLHELNVAAGADLYRTFGLREEGLPGHERPKEHVALDPSLAAPALTEELDPSHRK